MRPVAVIVANVKRLAFLVALACATGALAGTAPPVRLAAPPFPEPAQITSGGTALEVVSSEPLRGSDAAWARRNGLDLREYAVPAPVSGIPREPLPSFVATESRGLRLVRAIRQRKTILLIYGRDFASGQVLLALNPAGGFRYALDFARYGRAPVGALLYQELVWAVEADGVLYVETSHPTYAPDSGSRNGYLTAIDLATRKVRWRSGALVANAGRFELAGDLILSGYGFTAEPDYLYLVQRRTGRATGRLPLPTASDYVVRKGSLFYVRTYDHDIVARLVPA